MVAFQGDKSRRYKKVQDLLWPRLGNRTSPLQHSMGPRKSQGRPAGRGGEIGFTPQRDERQWLCPIFHLPHQEIHLTLSSRVPMPGLLSVSIGDDSPTGREWKPFPKRFQLRWGRCGLITVFVVVDKVGTSNPFWNSVACIWYEEEAEWSQFATHDRLLGKWLLFYTQGPFHSTLADQLVLAEDQLACWRFTKSCYL